MISGQSVVLLKQLCEPRESCPPGCSRRGALAEMHGLGYKTLEIAIKTIKIQECYKRKAVRATRTEENETMTYLKLMGKKLEALLSKIKKDREQQEQGAAKRESTRWRKAEIECHWCHQKGHFARECPTTAASRLRNGHLPLSQ